MPTRTDGTDHELPEAAALLRAARANGDTAEADRLVRWIDQRLDQILETGRD